MNKTKLTSFSSNKQENQDIKQKKFLKIFEDLLLEKRVNTFNQQKKNLFLLNNDDFNKKLDLFIIVNNLSKSFKSYLILNRHIFLLICKLNFKFSKKKKKKKKLDSYLKLFLLHNNFFLTKIQLLKKKNFNFEKTKIHHLLFINIRSNNIFINLICNKNNCLKIVKFWSCGLLKLHCTKRKLKFIVYTLLKEIKKKIKYLFFFIIKINCATFLHKFLYKNFKKLFLRSKFSIFDSFKIFNGCRSKKKRRKKHLKFRILR